ncbi:MAG: molybdopterin-guanine dinucleotide biosynthesis protein B, partial [SAR324 cluster bacterium]|nr:molybdopterin-guanine dinucleotide biosynthesis protein B [SAR324 cluster bacterium]
MLTNQWPKPVLGLCAYSGTGKTTLLSRLIPILDDRGIKVGVIKHAHHEFEMDREGKDSFRFRQAGAGEVL